ncbi:MAG: hypothetical protein F6K09_10880, partial [Merismopedia sp. SIO2A8]|nr:hypothetical protein [Merismopedia sp. SIO2A8]
MVQGTGLELMMKGQQHLKNFKTLLAGTAVMVSMNPLAAVAQTIPVDTPPAISEDVLQEILGDVLDDFGGEGDRLDTEIPNPDTADLE